MSNYQLIKKASAPWSLLNIGHVKKKLSNNITDLNEIYIYMMNTFFVQ
jgi:hypothetical protein